ncbi:hypothetical protein [Micromonospora sp. M71_S20]|nr:hypothetical protein [Micromonospora sp. M71_S20]
MGTATITGAKSLTLLCVTMTTDWSCGNRAIAPPTRSASGSPA